VGVIKGPAKDLSIVPMLTKRLTDLGSTLRSRTAADKATIINELERQVWPLIESGKIKPVVYKTFALADARGAHGADRFRHALWKDRPHDRCRPHWLRPR
jgi:NADPH2:quinone reductase